MNRIQQLAATADLAICRFDHPPHVVHKDPPEEVSSTYSINFVESGSFDLLVARSRWRMVPGEMFFATPGLRYRCRHGEDSPSDVCLSVDYGCLQVNLLPNTAALCRLPPVFKASNRLAYLNLRLKRSIQYKEALAGEAAAVAMWNALAECPQTQHQKRYARHQLAWYAERVEAIRELLESDYATQHSLASLARSVGMSTFHFVRIFRELTGLPPHRYLLAVRLQKALERLRDGGTVTETCFAVGFNNLSHFDRMFRRCYGASPSKLSARHAPAN